MEVLYQRSFFSTVKRPRDDELLAEAFFLSTDFEAVGTLKVELRNLLIKEARWDIYRSPGAGLNGGRDLPSLKGVEAWFGAGAEIRRVTGNDGGDLPREVLNECVGAVIQSETYFITERGYASTQSYEDYWKEMYLNSCCFYSNLSRVTRSWYDYIGGARRERCLFNRSKNSAVYRRPDGSLLATGNFVDSFHELGVSLSLSEEHRKVAACKGNFLRVPDPVCLESINRLYALAGNSIAGCSKGELAKIVGGPQSCLHLVDIINEASQAVTAVWRGETDKKQVE